MSVTTATIRAVSAVLDLDAGATPAIKQAVSRVLNADQSFSCGETEAARILDISQSSLNNWRNEKWANAPHAFIFHTWRTASDEIRYDRSELTAYNELRRVLSTRSTPQPDITREQLLSYLRFLEGKIADI